MAQTLTEIAEKLRNANKKVQLIYAFNGTGKTRLSGEFKKLISPKDPEADEEYKSKVLYYNAFTEDLFYWDNDLDADTNRKLTIRPNGFTNLTLQFLKDQGLDNNIVTNFQHFTSDSITPRFSADFSEVTFSVASGDNQSLDNIKISKGEESNFIWCVFHSLFEQVVEIFNTEPEDRFSDQFDHIEYVVVDDPVSSLDENHIIGLAVNLAELVRKSNGLKFIISTHNPLFYNVLYNELGNKTSYLFNKLEDGTYDLLEKKGDSNKSFTYHLYLRGVIKQAIDSNEVSKYHFVLLRNLYEKTANFLGYEKWSDLLPNDGREGYISRLMNFYSHSTLSSEEFREPTPPEKQMVSFLFNHLMNNSKYLNEEIAIESTSEESGATTITDNATV